MKDKKLENFNKTIKLLSYISKEFEFCISDIDINLPTGLIEKCLSFDEYKYENKTIYVESCFDDKNFVLNVYVRAKNTSYTLLIDKKYLANLKNIFYFGDMINKDNIALLTITEKENNRCANIEFNNYSEINYEKCAHDFEKKEFEAKNIENRLAIIGGNIKFYSLVSSYDGMIDICNKHFNIEDFENVTKIERGHTV